MRIELNPRLEAILMAQVAAGQFASIDDALTAAVLGVPVSEEPADDLAWAAPYLAEADIAITENRTVSETEAFADLEKRFGPL
jgi:hypothetical protein